MEKEKKYIEEALDSLNIRRESMKLILKEEQERAIKEFDFSVQTSLHDFYGS